ncbi:MAG: hypothetical protein ACI4GO_02230, partial [Hominenteromicrobium sp.]
QPRLSEARKKHVWVFPALCCACALSFAAAVWLQMWCFRNGYAYRAWYYSPTLFICALALFASFSLFSGAAPLPRLWRSISLASMGIYFLQTPVLRLLLRCGLFSAGALKAPVQTVLLIGACFLISLCVEAVLSLIPGVSRVLLLHSRSVRKGGEPHAR